MLLSPHSRLALVAYLHGEFICKPTCFYAVVDKTLVFDILSQSFGFSVKNGCGILGHWACNGLFQFLELRPSQHPLGIGIAGSARSTVTLEAVLMEPGLPTCCICEQGDVCGQNLATMVTLATARPFEDIQHVMLASSPACMSRVAMTLLISESAFRTFGSHE